LSCAGTSLPTRWDNLQANDGSGWKHPNVLSTGALTAPRPSHKYDYAIVGHQKALKFRLVDPDMRDNNGRLQIGVRTAVASDCAGEKYKAFGIPTLAACVAAAGDNGVVAAGPRIPTSAGIDHGPIVRVLRNSDVPGALNAERPSGALTAREFTAVDTSKKSAVLQELGVLTAHGFKSAAISEFHGPNRPRLKSTAVKLGSVARAQAAFAAFATVAARTHAPAGTTAVSAVDPAFPRARLLTFKLTAGGNVASIQIIVCSGAYLYTLQASGSSDTVSQAATEQLLQAIVSRG
jgi:hypothetical protein